MSHTGWVEIDGSVGEGGGQVLRSSLALSLATRQPVRLFNIRAKRKKPGLRRQHVTAVRAAARVGNAQLTGDVLDSGEIQFTPGPVSGGVFEFDIQSAGSATLVAQTILPVLLTAPRPSRVVITGGTHNPLCPPFEFLAETYLPLINCMGPAANAMLDRRGFFPAGGGRISLEIGPIEALTPFALIERGDVRRITAQAIVANLPRHIAERELNVARAALDLREHECTLIEDVTAFGPGNVVILQVECDALTETFTATGRRGVPAERVAEKAVTELRTYLDSGVAVGEHLADQLVLPLALAGGGCYVTHVVSEHLRTHIEIIRRFLPVHVDLREAGSGAVTVRVRKES